MNNAVRLLAKSVGLALASALTLSLAGCGKTYTYKYRITVTVRDHGLLRSASNVVSVQEEASTLTHGSSRPVLCGEATVIPLRDGKVLFGLLKGAPHDPVMGQYQWRSSPTGVLLDRLGLETQWSWKNDSGLRHLPETRKVVDLRYYEMPDFVTFADLKNPTTIRRVDPEHPEWTLGEGVRIEKATLQVTDERVTRGGVKPVLPWLNTWKTFLDGSQWGESVHGFQSSDFANCNRLTE